MIPKTSGGGDGVGIQFHQTKEERKKTKRQKKMFEEVMAKKHPKFHENH